VTSDDAVAGFHPETHCAEAEEHQAPTDAAAPTAIMIADVDEFLLRMVRMLRCSRAAERKARGIRRVTIGDRLSTRVIANTSRDNTT
jgi:hypothetical protein